VPKRSSPCHTASLAYGLPDGGDRLKRAFNDAFQRTAVNCGIGRHLYRLPSQ
jgi:hypothetical protein